LKQKVQRAIGWPIYAVVPCRDFAYIFATQDEGLIPRLGNVVVNECERSGYPITTEVLRISDTGTTAVGSFAARREGAASKE
jgi:hypothetical protein